MENSTFRSLSLLSIKSPESPAPDLVIASGQSVAHLFSSLCCTHLKSSRDGSDSDIWNAVGRPQLTDLCISDAHMRLGYPTSAVLLELEVGVGL